MPHLCTARGHVERGRKPDAMLKVAISLDSETFCQVRSRAVKAGQSFAAEVRDLIEWGLEADNAA